jgi:hypothetical protein
MQRSERDAAGGVTPAEAHREPGTRRAAASGSLQRVLGRRPPPLGRRLRGTTDPMALAPSRARFPAPQGAAAPIPGCGAQSLCLGLQLGRPSYRPLHGRRQSHQASTTSEFAAVSVIDGRPDVLMAKTVFSLDEKKACNNSFCNTGTPRHAEGAWKGEGTNWATKGSSDMRESMRNADKSGRIAQ